jgi:hypothetical protein
VLSTPPAFVLSQDQTLQQKLVEKLIPAKPSKDGLAKGITHPTKLQGRGIKP